MKRKTGIWFIGLWILAGCAAPTVAIGIVESPTAVPASPTRTPQTAAPSPTDTAIPTLTATPQRDDAPPIVVNGDFEEGTGAPLSWTQEAWIAARSDFRWGEFPGCKSKCVSIVNTEENDARWIQEIRIVPGLLYRLSGWIKGEDIRGNSIGANLFAGGGFNHSQTEGSTGTFDWKLASVTFIGPPEGSIVIGCRLGFFGSTVTGTAYCDDIQVDVEITFRRLEGRNIDLYLEEADLDPAIIRPETLAGWVDNLDRTYEEYASLVGAKPYGGAKIQILSVREYPGGWAVAGNPILWHQPYVRGELSLVEKENDWSFGILHEIGHDFDIEDRWNFHAEFFANFKMYYAAARLNAKVSPSHPVYYEGAGLKEYYKSKIVPGQLSWDGITYRFIVMAEEIGWKPFQETFRCFLELGENEIPSTRLEKYYTFMDMLSGFSGQDVYRFLPVEEMALLEKDLQT